MADADFSQLYEQCGQLINTLPDSEILNDTSTTDRFAKKQAIRSVKEAIFEHIMDTDDTFKAVFLEALWDSLLLWLTSDVEYVREQSVKFLQEYFEQVTKVPSQSTVTERLVDLIQDRMSHHSVGASVSFTEPSEEIRVYWMEFAIVLLNKADPETMGAVQMESLLGVVQSAFEDPFSQVQKEGGNLLIVLAKVHPKLLGFSGDRPLGLVASLLSHKHSPIRIVALKAACHVALVTPDYITALFKAVDDRPASFPSLAYDSSANVRSLACKTAGALLVDLAPKYRYQYAGKLLPIVMAAIVDDVQSVTKEGLEVLSSVNKVCLEDLIAAQVITADSQEAQSEEYGIAHLLHMSHEAAFESVTRDIADLREDWRFKSLGVFELLLKYADVDDLVAKQSTFQGLFDLLFQTYCHGKDEERIKDKVKDILQLLGAKLPKAIYTSCFLPRLQKDKPKHIETMNFGTFGLTVTIIMLQNLIATTLPEDLDEDIVGPLLNVLDTEAYVPLFIQDKQLSLETANLMSVVVERQDISNTNTLTDTVRFRVVWLGTKLRAASALGRHQLESSLTADHTDDVDIEKVGSPVIQAVVDKTLRMLIHPTPAVMSVYAHYLPTILGRLRKPRDGKGPGNWVESSIEFKMLEVVLSAVDVEAFEGEGTPEQLVEIFCMAGTKKSKSDTGIRDISAHVGNLMVRQRVLNLLAQIFAIDDEYQHFWIYSDYLLEKLIRVGLGTHHSTVATSEATNAYHLALLNCLETGVRCRGFNHRVIQGDILLHLERWLLYQNDDVRHAAVKCSMSLLDYVASANHNPEIKVACQCLASALLDRLDDSNLQVRNTILDGLQSANPSSVFYDPEDGILQSLKERLAKMLQALPEDDENRGPLLTLIEQRNLQLAIETTDE